MFDGQMRSRRRVLLRKFDIFKYEVAGQQGGRSKNNKED
jgi:hypothetical protein